MPTPSELQQLMGVCMALLDKFLVASGGVVQIPQHEIEDMNAKVDCRLVNGTWHVIRIPGPPKSTVIAPSMGDMQLLNGHGLK